MHSYSFWGIQTYPANYWVFCNEPNFRLLQNTNSQSSKCQNCNHQRSLPSGPFFFSIFRKRLFYIGTYFWRSRCRIPEKDTAFVQKADHKFSFSPEFFSLVRTFSLESLHFIFKYSHPTSKTKLARISKSVLSRWPFLYNTPNNVTNEIENRHYRQRDTDSFGNVHSTQKAFQTFTFLNIFMEFKRWSSFSER